MLSVPDEDTASQVLRPTEHTKHRPFKGDAAKIGGSRASVTTPSRSRSIDT